MSDEDAITHNHNQLPRLGEFALFLPLKLTIPHPITICLTTAGVGVAMTDALESAGIQRATDLAGRTPAELSVIAGGGLAAEVAARLVDMGKGLDRSAVVDKGPPKTIQVSLSCLVLFVTHSPALDAIQTRSHQYQFPPPSPQVQMTLTWANLAHHSGLKDASGQPLQIQRPSSAQPAPGTQPLLTGRPDTLTRLGAIINALQGDLLGRVVVDR
jgi:hypothetical protein